MLMGVKQNTLKALYTRKIIKVVQQFSFVQFLIKKADIMTLYNQTNITNFRLDIPDADITKAFSLNVQSALIPGIRIPVTDMPLGNKGLGRAKLPGSTVDYDPLIVRVLVDENLDAYTDIYTWMLSINNYITHDNEGWKENVLPTCITLHILNNNRTKIVMSIHYYGAWPSDMADLEYNLTDESDPAVFLNVTFNYRYFTIEKDGIIITHRKTMEEQLKFAKSKKLD